MLATGLFSLLAGSEGIAALVGARIYPVLLPEDVTLPALTYTMIGGSSKATFDTSGFQKVRIQFDCFSDQASGGYLSAATVREALRDALNGFQGLLSDGTFLQYAELIQGTDYYEEYPRQFRCMSEFYLYFTFNS